jgi:hypothetical protein
MPTRQVPGSGLTYELISFDAEGRERTDDPDGLMSQRAAETVAQQPVTDVFFISHGWRGDIPGAIDQYDRWITAMAATPADLEQMRQARPGFRPLLIGLHWPSEPWGDEELDGRSSGGASFAPGEGVSKEHLIDRYAARLADTDAARAALRTLFDVAERNIAPPALPPEAVEAYQVLNREAGLGGDGPGGAPDADREPFDPQAMYRNVRRARASFGGFTLGGLLLPLRLLSFWKMKDRARLFGESGGRQLLAELQQAAPADRRVRFHLMGHSFGCVVVSAIVGAAGGPALRPVDSLVLAQGALSLWSYCTEIPPAPGQRGYFRSIVEEGRVAGPIVTTQSSLDHAVGRFYPYGAGIRQQVTFAPGELPKYGSVGTFGVRGPGLTVEDREMLDLDGAYGFAGGTIYNLDASRWIKALDGPSGAHNDIAHPQVAHAIWEAARVS